MMYLSFVKYLFIYGTPEPSFDPHFLYEAIFPSLLLLIFGRRSSQQDFKTYSSPRTEHTRSRKHVLFGDTSWDSSRGIFENTR